MTEEVARAQTASESNSDTPFDKIIRKEIPAKIIYEDEHFLAFHDRFPQAPIHFLVIPNKKITKMDALEEEDSALMGKMLLLANRLAREQKLEEGYRIVVNNGKHGCQTVYHLHLHVIGGRQLTWPPGTTWNYWAVLRTAALMGYDKIRSLFGAKM